MKDTPESRKIFIVDSHESDMAQKLMDLIRSGSDSDACIVEWNDIPDSSCDIILPVLKSPLAEWNTTLHDLTSRFTGAAIVPVFNEDDSNLSEALSSPENDYSDFIVYPYRKAEVLARIERFFIMPCPDHVSQVKKHLMQKWALRKFVGKNKIFVEMVNNIPVVAGSDVDVLIQGETGTGKELFARAVHYQSPRRPGPFVAINSASLTATLFENEMFGHVKEAFTDAKSSRSGVIQEAEGGTLFLDEVDTLEKASQAKLLRFLEEREYKPLGSSKPVKADVRIIAASNTDLESSVKEKKFRQDLYYRLNVIALTLPPLRERREDIPLLTGHFLKKYAGKFGEKRLSPDATKMFYLHSWPGNIRELENAIQQLMIMDPHEIIKTESLPFQTNKDQQDVLFKTFKEAKQKTVEEFEKEYISNILGLHNGNITQAAKAAGKDRREFGRLVKKYDLL